MRGIDVEPNRRHEAFTYVCVCVDSLFLSKGNFKGEEEGGGFTTEEEEEGVWPLRHLPPTVFFLFPLSVASSSI